MGRANHMPYATYRRGIARLLTHSFNVDRVTAIKLLKKWNDVIVARWAEGKDIENTARHVFKYETQGVVCPCHERRDCPSRRRRRVGRDAENPRPGEIYQSKAGNRWLVKGRTSKGRVVLQRTAPKYTGDVYWTPSMLSKLKQVRVDEAKAVAAMIPKDLQEARFPSGASLLDRILNRKKPQSGEQLSLPGMRDPNRRYYVYVIETLKNGKRSFYVGQTGKKPEERFKEHKSGHHYSYAKGAKLLRKDLTKKVPPLFTRQQAERAERIIAKTLRKRGLRVSGGH